MDENSGQIYYKYCQRLGFEVVMQKKSGEESCLSSALCGTERCDKVGEEKRENK